jgi:hypothetical protein
MTGETRFVDVVWRGLRLAQKARLAPSAESAGFVEIDAPLPVGSRVRLEGEGGFAVEARVVTVVEQESGARSPPGMRVDWSAEKPAEVSSIAVTSSDLLPVEEPAGDEPTEAAEESTEPPAPTDGKRKRRRQKTIIGRP